MKNETRPTRRDPPHPLVTLGGALFALALVIIGIKGTILPRGVTILLAVSFIVTFRYISRWSAKVTRERREREMEQLRNTPVLHLSE